MAEATPPEHTEELQSMLKRRGFLQPAYGLYGGVSGFYDYGPLGQGLKRQFEALWRQHYVVEEGFGEVSTPTVAPEAVFRASGHLDQFDDMLVRCPDCDAATRADHLLVEEFDRLAAEVSETIETHLDELADPEAEKALIECRDLVLDEIRKNRAVVETEADEATIRRLLCVPDEGDRIVPLEERIGPFTVTYLSSSIRVNRTGGDLIVANAVRCPACNTTLHEQAKVGPFNLMFATRIGPGDGEPGYIRPETAQGMFVNFDWLYRYHREQVPFGAVQIGRAYRNEIAPRQGLIRLREFWQAEAEVFVDPEDKTHPRFARAAELEVPLVPASGEPASMRLGDAVEKGVIANEMVAYFMWRTYRVLTEAGLDPERIRFRQHESDEMAHYAADCWDAEFESSRYGWVECVGIADRGCYDLEAHEKESGQSMAAFRRFEETIEREITRIEPDMSALGPVFKDRAGEVAEALGALDAEQVSEDEPLELDLEDATVEVPPGSFEVVEETERVTGERFLPHVIEPSYGIDRILYAVLEHNFDPKQDADDWHVLRLPARMAPIQVGVLPLVSKDGLPDAAQELEDEIRARGLVTMYDDGGSIGRRYARLDEAGTPYCVTIDHETLEQGTVTIRDRDTQDQARVPTGELSETLEALVAGELRFEDLRA